MRVDVEHIEIFRDDEGVDRRGLQRGGLHDEVDLFHDLGAGVDPAHAEAGGEDLGEGAEVDDQILFVHAAQRGQELALEAQVAVGVVLDRGDLILVDDLHELLAALKRHRAAGGILEVGDDVDELDVFGRGKHAVQLFHDHAVLVGGHLDKVGLILLEGVDRAEIGGAFQHDDVAGVEKQLADEVETLLAAGRQDQMIGVGDDVVLRGQTVGDLIAQMLGAFGHAVLQRGGAALVHHGVHRGLQVGDREELRRGKSAGKGNDLGSRGEL